MNKKVYFGNRYLLLTSDKTQPSANQLIVNTDGKPTESIEKIINDFIQQNDNSDLIIISNDVNSIFENLKKQFIYIEAAGGLIRQNDKYLFIYRLNKWDLPKGKIDQGEGSKQAAIRECMEECAVSGLKILSELPQTYHIYPYKNSFALKNTYWYLMETDHSNKLVPQTSENIEKAEWLTIRNIKKMVLKNTYPSVTDIICPIIDYKK